MSEWKLYNRRAIPAVMRPYEPGEDLEGVSIGDEDRANGSPKLGDMIARDLSNEKDLWLVNADYFAKKFYPEPIDD